LDRDGNMFGSFTPLEWESVLRDVLHRETFSFHTEESAQHSSKEISISTAKAQPGHRLCSGKLI
jgi:hypothetical protein